MDNFIYFSPTKIIFGRGAEDAAAKEIKAFGGSRVLLHYGGGSAEKSGLLGKLRAQLNNEGLFFIELGGAVPNPRLSLAREAVKLCRDNDINFILAAGGGSAIDSAKAASVGFYDDGFWDFYDARRAPERALPIGVVLTLAAAGSESSNSSVITNEDGWLKRGLTSDLIRPKFSCLNPEYTFSLDAYTTACGVVDIMMHTMDRYFSPTKETDFIDRLSEGLLSAVVRAGAVAVKDPQDYAARAELMWAGSMSHNGLMGTGKVVDFAPHHIEHELSGKYDVAHGAGLAAVWGHWARFVYKTNAMKFAQFAVRVWNVPMDFEDPEKTAVAGIDRTVAFFKSIGMPTNLKELGVSPSAADIREMAEKAIFFGRRKLGGFKILDFDEIVRIYTATNA